MNNRKVIPNWLSVILLILCIASLIVTVYMLITVESAKPLLTISSSLLFMASTVYAIIYCIKGYQKDANKYYKGFAILFLVTEFVTVISFIVVTIEMKTDLSLEALILDNYLWFVGFSITMLVCMFPLAIAKDLKIEHATIAAGIHLLCAIAAMVLSFNENVSILTNNYIKKNTVNNNLLTVFLLISLTLFFCIVQQAAGEDHIFLSVGIIIFQLIFFAFGDVFQCNGFAVCNAVANAFKFENVICVNLVVIICIFECKGHNAGVNQVCAVDSCE